MFLIRLKFNCNFFVYFIFKFNKFDELIEKLKNSNKSQAEKDKIINDSIKESNDNKIKELTSDLENKRLLEKKLIE